MAKLFECNGLELAGWARGRVEDDDEDEDDEDALCWSLPTLVAAEGRDGLGVVDMRRGASAAGREKLSRTTAGRGRRRGTPRSRAEATRWGMGNP